MVDLALPSPGSGLIVALPAEPAGVWRCWPVEDGALTRSVDYLPGEDRPWRDPGEGARIIALVPASDAPVRIVPRPALPLPQALAAARLEATEGLSAGATHVASAAGEDGRTLLVATAAQAQMDRWLAMLASAGLEQVGLVPAALVLPPAIDDTVIAVLAGQPLARTPAAAFAAEDALVAALAVGEARLLDGAAFEEALLATWITPPLDLRQGVYAPKRVSFFAVPDWRRLARTAAVAALLGFLILAVETVKLNLDASSRERAALVAAQARFPAAADLAQAQTLASAELVRRGQGGGAFAIPAAAVLAAMRPLPSLTLRDLSYGADGVLRFQAAAPRPDDINRLLLDLQAQGWKVTVPPQLAPDPTGTTVAAITVLAP
ncbi:MAG: type II secretion system protein GspL [Novosphingobium sp.]